MDEQITAPTPIRGDGMRKMLLSVLLVLAVGWAAYLLSREPPPAGRENLINISVNEAEVEPIVSSSSPADVERYIQDFFGVKVNIPKVNGAQIVGAGAIEIRRGIEIPTVLLDDPRGDVERLLVFTYSLLDDWARGIYLERAVRVELEHAESKVVVTTEDGREVVLWRSGDDIVLAVAKQGASRLIRRIAG